MRLTVKEVLYEVDAENNGQNWIARTETLL